MICPRIPQVGFDELQRVLDSRAVARRIPYLGTLVLTYRCNQRCAHCYCNRPADDPVALARELTREEAFRLIDEIADAGCLWLLLTGGEPLLRPDFREVYLHAVRRGIFVELFTNGTLLTPALAGLFADYPPFGVECTIYGATQETHDRVTGMPGSLGLTLAGVRMLRDAGVDVAVKAMLMSINKGELPAMEELAASLGLRHGFTFDTTLVSRLDGDPRNRGLRLTPEEAVALDFADPGRRGEYRELYEALSKVPARDVLLCGAGQAVFTVDPYGRLQPCDAFPHLAYDLRTGAFERGWREAMPRFRREIEETLTPECLGCDKVALCESCSGYALLEHGSYGRAVDSLCRKAHLRREALKGSGPPEPAVCHAHGGARE
ncbi:MAG: radical SAM protein [Elusimicrobia bacterium]|nr:radical SAM protein [Elusimicrobiota bacterium]